MAELGKVLVLSASAGAGHLRAAQAVERALIGMGAVREVRHIDVLEYTNKVFRNFYSKAYIEVVNSMPDVLGWLYDYLDKPWKNERRRLAFDKLNTRPFVKLLQQERPDVVVCTHFLPAEIISWLKAKERISTRQAIVVTDFDVHAMWLVHHFEHYFVALDETRAHLQQLGIATEKITVPGIPIDPVFAEQKDKRTMRRKHGLKEDRTTILISAGGFGVGPIEHLVQSLLGLLHPAQIVAVCGRGKDLKTRLDRMASRRLPPNISLHVTGYTTDMDEYMAAADLLVGKSGKTVRTIRGQVEDVFHEFLVYWPRGRHAFDSTRAKKSSVSRCSRSGSSRLTRWPVAGATASRMAGLACFRNRPDSTAPPSSSPTMTSPGTFIALRSFSMLNSEGRRAMT